MALESIIDTALAGFKRSKELEAETKSQYHQWHSEVESELEVFLHRAKDVDIESSTDRDEFYDYLETFENRVRQLRSRSEASEAPTKALIELEDLADLAEETNRPAYVVTATWGATTPFEKRKREKREREREQRHQERIEEEIEEFVGQIEDVRDSFDLES